MNDPDGDTLPVVRACELADPCAQRRWLVDTLWARAGVGIIGGAPKVGKSWIGLDLAVSVASATPCLDTFAVQEPGPTLLFMAEDAAAAVKARLNGLCRHRGLDLAALPIHVITTPTLRLDLADDQRRLQGTVARLRPRLLLLDPFVRLHKINENDAGDVSAILAYLRHLQRSFDLAVVVVHHSRKNGRPGGAGPNLRGSSDFHAWSDSSLYLHHHQDVLVLTSEHRAAPAPEPMTLRLHADENVDQTHFELVDESAGPHDTSSALEAAILAALAQQPLTRAQLRAALRVRNQRLGITLDRLAQSGHVARQHNRWVVPIPAPIEHPERNASNRGDQLPLDLQPA